MQCYFPFILEKISIVLALTVVNKSDIFNTIKWIRNVAYLDVFQIKYIFENGAIFYFALQLAHVSRAYKRNHDVLCCLSCRISYMTKYFCCYAYLTKFTNYN